ncbi:hypothetical protein VN12_02675 [Pirellula sp. SH-Sr6A]|uniref:hypothetical protein n=1 Tax=Pirellula sp. SH-Sr6A TaxID=1632865 RepID=UPI00078C9599|nr:hypothetical protein [Pirellula sp. SH-Sr6A]AMV30992.1 hypothetical protein VN12_02675 [Pirellula sp. SH-Sr6A]
MRVHPRMLRGLEKGEWIRFQRSVGPPQDLQPDILTLQPITFPLFGRFLPLKSHGLSLFGGMGGMGRVCVM